MLICMNNEVKWRTKNTKIKLKKVWGCLAQTNVNRELQLTLVLLLLLPVFVGGRFIFVLYSYIFDLL